MMDIKDEPDHHTHITQEPSFPTPILLHVSATVAELPRDTSYLNATGWELHKGSLEHCY